MKVICISGKARSGKDTFAGMLEQELSKNNSKVLVTHYADLLKYICRTYFNWNGEKDETGRRLLQKIGTDVVRKKKPDFWVDFTVNILNFFYDSWDCVIIPDCRFENEIEALKCHEEFDVTTVRVERPDYDNGLTESQKKHISETDLDGYGFDYVVENSGGLNRLADSAKLVASDIYDN